MYSKVFILNIPNYYKINLLNKLSKKINIYVIFISKYSNADGRTKSFSQLEYCDFEYEFLNDDVFQTRNKTKNIFKIHNRLKLLSYKCIIVGEWNGIEYLYSLLISWKKNREMILESTINEKQDSFIKDNIKKLFLLFVDRVYASGIQHKQLLDYLGYKKEVIFTNGVGIANKQSIRKENYTKIPTRFLFVGRITEVKNLSFIIGIFNNFQNLTLTIVGDGSQKSMLQKKVKANIKFIDYIENSQIAEVYITHDVFILPSLKEPWGLVVEEALYYGLPVLCSNTVGSSDYYVKGKDTGLVFDARDTNDCISSIENMINNYDSYVKNVKEIDYVKEEHIQVKSYINL
jgi:glycosyltransferase involved in cell wall biosynthesis